VDLVSYQSGTLIAIPGLEEIKKLETYLNMDILIKPGDKLVPTVDCITIPGSISLASQDSMLVETDFLRIHAMTEKPGFFLLEEDQKARSAQAQPASHAIDEDDSVLEDNEEVQSLEAVPSEQDASSQQDAQDAPFEEAPAEEPPVEEEVPLIDSQKKPKKKGKKRHNV